MLLWLWPGELSPSWLERLGWIAIAADVVTLTYCCEPETDMPVEFLCDLLKRCITQVPITVPLLSRA